MFNFIMKNGESEFQAKRTFEERCRDSASIAEQHPDKVAVIVERSKGPPGFRGTFL